MVEEKGMRNPRRPSSVGLPGWEVRRCGLMGEEKTYQDVWQDLLLVLKVGKRVFRIGPGSIEVSSGESTRYGHW